MKTKTSSGKKTPAPKTKSGKSKTNSRGIVFLGFMGAGKTVVAEALAEKLNCQWVDLDEIIETTERKSIAELFEKFGETVFREIETAALREVLAGKTIRVVALGGGAWTLKRNRRLVAESGCLAVWLDAPFELCWRRIVRDRGEERPNARDPRAARSLYDTRREFYALAPLRVRVRPERAAEDIAAEILRAARQPRART